MAKRNSIQAVAFSTALIVTAMSFPMTASAQECTPADIFGVASIQRNPGSCHSTNGILCVVPIERITLDNVPLCYLLNAGSG